jgi:hypothetical protein
LFGKLVRKVGDKVLGKRLVLEIWLKFGKDLDMYENLRKSYGKKVMLRACVF